MRLNNLISILSDIRSGYDCFDPEEEKRYRALSEAIKMLSAQTDLQSNLQPTCNQLATDCISRQTVLNWLKNEWNGMVTTLFNGIKELPSAQPERKTGHWIRTARWGRVYYCNQCRNYLDFDGVNVGRGSANFCPNCGADMRGEQDG